jgi:hypothetical protein
MAAVVTLEIVTGSINSQRGSGKAYVFHAPHASSPRKGLKETFLATAMKECPGVGSKIRTILSPARVNVLAEIGGTITNGQYAIAEGEVLKLFAQKKSAGWNGVMRTAAVFIRMRSEAAFNRINITVPQAVPDSVSPLWTASGRFDILTADEARGMGVSVLKSCEGHYTKAAFDSLFTLEVLAPQIAQVAKVVTKVVGDKVMPTMRKRRGFELV